jgi:hypothetical protein
MLQYAFLALTALRYVIGLYRNLYASYTWVHLMNLIAKDMVIFSLLWSVADVKAAENAESKAYIIARSMPVIMTVYASIELLYTMGFTVRQTERDTAA